MSQRYFVDQPIAADRVLLAGDEGRHLATVMRATAGVELALFDGRGAEFVGRISRVKKHEVEIEVVSRTERSRELPYELTLAVALPKGDRQKWLVEKLTELGVTRLTPLITERGVAQPVASALDRLKRGVIEASKQCGRNRLMEIAEPVTVAQLLAAHGVAGNRLFADPTGQPFAEAARGTAMNLIAAVGPEGGFTPGEAAAARVAGWQIVSLGPRILRVETAAIALAAKLGLC